MPEWNSLTDTQRSEIIDRVILPEPHERAQMAVEIYNAARDVLRKS